VEAARWYSRPGDKMLTLELAPNLEKRLARLAESVGRPADDLARELLVQGLEDLDDALIAHERLERPEGWYTLEDLDEGRDLEG